MNREKDNTLLQPFKGDRFRFECHKDVQCFTKCCAHLNLILTPYDIVRMKNRLDVSSDDFLEKYTDTTFDKHPRFPMVTLKMNQDENKRCPFVNVEGCTIYEDRPGACRIYPLGRAALKVDRDRDTKEKYFFVHEDHCLGFQENREWTIEEWLNNEGVNEYNAMNDQWLEIITSPRSLGAERDIRQKIQMFFMASYNLDRFRKFIFKSRFFDLFEMDPELNDRLASDDVALMQFSFDWLKFSLFGEKTIRVKSRTTQPIL